MVSGGQPLFCKELLDEQALLLAVHPRLATGILEKEGDEGYNKEVIEINGQFGTMAVNVLEITFFGSDSKSPDNARSGTCAPAPSRPGKKV